MLVFPRAVLKLSTGEADNRICCDTHLFHECRGGLPLLRASVVESPEPGMWEDKQHTPAPQVSRRRR